jgi:hypothetical protein
MELLTKEQQSLIAMTLRDGVSDRDSHCLVRDDQSVIYHQISQDLVFQAGFSPENYPSWFSQVLPFDEDQLRERIIHLVDNGWTITKTQFSDLISE